MAAAALKDRILQKTTDTGTGTLTLAAADDPRFTTYVAAGLASQIVFYCIAHRTLNEWEVGYGTVSAGGVLTRTAVIRNHLGTTALVSFSAGEKDVFEDVPAEKALALDPDSAQLSLPGDLNLANGAAFKINGTSVLNATTLGAGVTASSLTSVGTLTGGTWHANTIAEAYGGTNQTTYTLGDLLYASAANTLSKLAGNTVAAKRFLRQTGTGTVSAAPAWDTVDGSDLVGTTLAATIVSSSLTGIGTLSSGAVPASLVTTGTFGAGNYVFPADLSVLGNLAVTGTITAAAATLSGLLTANAGATVASGQTLTLTGATVAGAPTWSSSQAITISTATQASITTMANLTTVGALAAGSLASGFGNISIGASSVTAGAASFTTGAFSSTVTLSAADARFKGGTTAGRMVISDIDTRTYISIYGQTSAFPDMLEIVAGAASVLTATSTAFTVKKDLTVGSSTFVVTAATGAVAITAASANATVRLTRTGTFPGDFTLQAGGYATPTFLIYDNTAAAERFVISAAQSTLSSPLAITGALTGVTKLTVSGATFDSVYLTGTTGQVGTAIITTGGYVVMGSSSSAGGGFITGLSAYAGVFATLNATDLVLGTNSAARLTLNGSTGAATFAGTVAHTGTGIFNQSNGGGLAAISLPNDESTIQGPGTDTFIKMGSNCILSSSNVASVQAKNASGYINFLTGTTPTEAARFVAGGQLQFANITATPAGLADGQLWYDGSNLRVRLGGATKTVTVA